MYTAIVRTILSKLVVLCANFFLVIYTAHLWGSTGRGTIALFMADLAMVSIVIDVVAGSSLAYYSSRYGLRHLLSRVYAWSFAVSVLVPVALNFVRHQEYLYQLIAASFALALLSSSAQIFVGRKQMGRYNLLQSVQPSMQVFLAVSFCFLFPNIDRYFYALIASYLLIFTISVWLMKRLPQPVTSDGGNVLWQLMRYGGMSQMSVFMQFLNYRLVFYFLAAVQTVGSVGVFSVGVALSEALWIICRSVSIVIFSRSIHTSDRAKMEDETKFAMKLSFYATLAATIAVLVIPGWVYTVVFGNDFSETKTVIICLLPGILALSVSDIAGHYFASQRQLIVLTVKSSVGLAATVVLSVLLIPQFGIWGACIAMSSSYIVSSVVLLLVFFRQVPVRRADLFIARTDWDRVGEMRRKCAK